MEKITVRKKLSLVSQTMVLLGIALLIFIVFSILQWRERSEKLENIVRLQKIGMDEYANVQIKKFFKEQPATLEAYRLKLNGLLKLQSSLIHIQSNVLGETFVRLVGGNSRDKLEYDEKSTQLKLANYFTISSSIVSTIFDMHLLGHISEEEKNQLLAMAYFKLGPNYFELAQQYFSVFIDDSFLNIEKPQKINEKIFNKRLILEALLQIHDAFGKYAETLVIIEKIALFQGEITEKEARISDLRLAKYLFINEKTDKALEVLKQSFNAQTASPSIDGSYFVTGCFLIGLLDYKGNIMLANYYLSLMQHRMNELPAGNIAMQTEWKKVEDFIEIRKKKGDSFSLVTTSVLLRRKYLINKTNPIAGEAVKLPFLYVFSNNLL